MTVGEVRIYPVESTPAGAPGTWSGDPLKIPKGGLESQTLRFAPLGSVRPFVIAKANPTYMSPPSQAELQVRQFFLNYMLPGADVLKRPRPRRNVGRDDRYYAELARDYVNAIESGSRRPTLDLMRQRREKSYGRMRDQIHEARVRGLLSKGNAGVRGGSLRPAALALLGVPPAQPRTGQSQRKSSAKTKSAKRKGAR